MKTDFDLAFEEFEKECSEGKVVRKQMIEMLAKQISKCEISECDKALMVTAKMGVLKTLDDLIKSNEETTLKKLKMKLARKDSESNGLVGQTIVNLLKNIRVTGEPSDTIGSVNRDNVIEELQKKQEGNKDLAISDGEIEECGSLPSTDGNEPVIKKKEKEDEEDE